MSHDQVVQASRNGRQAADIIKVPDLEVVPKAERRQKPSPLLLLNVTNPPSP